MPTEEQQLAGAIGKIEEFLNSQAENHKAMKRCVRFIANDLIRDWLGGHCDKIDYTGSSYDGTSIPGYNPDGQRLSAASDHDLQFCLKMPRSTEAVDLRAKGWQGLDSGPADLMDDDSLSWQKARNMILSSIDRGLGNGMKIRQFEGSRVEITRSTGHGPSAILNVNWAGHKFSIDIVAAVSADDLVNSGGCNLVAKPYTRPTGMPHDPNARQYYPWRKSFAIKEQQKMEEYGRTRHGRRKLMLLRILKLIKANNTQLQMFPSYFYKNALYHFCDSYYEDNKWETKEQLAARFKDILRFIATKFEERKLECYFEKTTNLLEWYDSSKVAEVASFIRGIVECGKFLKLVKHVPGI